MPAVHRLLLEDALQDSPQTRSLLSVFEEDAGTLTDYTNQLLQSLQRVFGAQNEMSLATQQLSKQLLEYEKQNFALGKGDEEVIGTLQDFSKVVDELNTLHTELAKQLADRMVFPMIQFREKDLTEISTLKDIFAIASSEHDASMAKYSRLPKRRENEKLKTEVVGEVAYSRRKQHQASMQYYCALNALQYRKRVAMLQPMLGYTQAQASTCSLMNVLNPVNFFKKGMDMASKKMESFLSSVTSMNQSIQSQLDSEAEAMRQAQRELLSVEDSIYMPDQDASNPLINRNLIQKAGYLNIRNKTGLVTTSWDRLYFFTQGGNLMCQPRGAVAGGMVLDLDNSSVMAVDCEDRRYCFQITSPDAEPSSKRDHFNTAEPSSKRDHFNTAEPSSKRDHFNTAEPSSKRDHFNTAEPSSKRDHFNTAEPSSKRDHFNTAEPSSKRDHFNTAEPSSKRDHFNTAEPSSKRDHFNTAEPSSKRDHFNTAEPSSKRDHFNTAEPSSKRDHFNTAEPSSKRDHFNTAEPSSKRDHFNTAEPSSKRDHFNTAEPSSKRDHFNTAEPSSKRDHFNTAEPSSKRDHFNTAEPSSKRDHFNTAEPSSKRDHFNTAEP
ncbi:DCC-interacting protein 13-beta [Acipenser ruthenus]|uniref:DCC-interacting protein 13-beta n=1 Tax=Acipenser ruthenus TaxID=7906 RepID=A0A662YUA5_ACIRT|nr:DCC-interacting protein 13-beta [Acipenser ruthenus]